MCAMVMAILLIMVFTPLGFITIGPMAMTLMCIPVIIGALLLGPGYGLAFGLVFGLASMFKAYTTPTITSVIFMDPLVALLPRLMIGPAAWVVSKLLRRFMPGAAPVAWGISAGIGTAVNTAGVLCMLFWRYASTYAEALGIATNMVAGALMGVVITNGLPECALSVIVITPVMLALSKSKIGYSTRDWGLPL